MQDSVFVYVCTLDDYYRNKVRHSRFTHEILIVDLQGLGGGCWEIEDDGRALDMGYWNCLFIDLKTATDLSEAMMSIIFTYWHIFSLRQ